MDQLPTIERWMNTCEWGSFRPEVSTSGIIQENDRQTQKNEKKHRSWWKCHGNCSWSDVIKFSTAAVRDKRVHLGRRVARCKNCARTGRVSHVKLSMTCKWVSFGCWRIRPSRTHTLPCNLNYQFSHFMGQILDITSPFIIKAFDSALHCETRIKKWPNLR